MWEEIVMKYLINCINSCIIIYINYISLLNFVIIRFLSSEDKQNLISNKVIDGT